MLTKIIEFSVKNKLIIALLVLGLMGIGSYQVTKLPIDAVPDITNNQVQVITIAPSFGATDIERLVTFPIEQANNNISGLKKSEAFPDLDYRWLPLSLKMMLISTGLGSRLLKGSSRYRLSFHRE
jgi:Cu/Ag efflux pump CusA